MYYCTKCDKRHKKSSIQGKEHKKYMMLEPYYCEKCGREHSNPNDGIYTRHIKYIKENPVPIMAIAAAAPMIMDVGKEVMKDPKLLIKPFGVARAVGRSFGFGKDAKENPPFTDFESVYGKRVYPEIKVIVDKNSRDYSPSVLVYYRFMENESNVSIIYGDVPEPESFQIFFVIDDIKYLAHTEGGIVYLLNPETYDILARIIRDSYSWILYPPSGEMDSYKPTVPDEIPKKDMEYNEEYIDIGTFDLNPPRKNSWSSVIKAAKPLIKKAVPVIKRGAKYIAEHPEIITTAGEAVSKVGGAFGDVVTAARRDGLSPNPKKKINTLTELYEFVGGEY